MTSPILILMAATALLSALAVTRMLIPVLTRRALDHPNARSSHVRPTPRGGGIAVIGAILIGSAGLYFGGALGDTQTATVAPVAVGLVLLAAVSFLDDLKPRPAVVRLMVQLFAVAIGLMALGEGAFAHWLPLPADMLVTGFLWLWFLNLFNFMDGIDGLAGVEVASVGIGLAVLAAMGLAPQGVGALGLIVGCAGLGFLVFNWHPARIFMGDVGSVPLGYLLGFLLILTAATANPTAPAIGLAAALLLPMVFVLDASATLVRRLVRGKRPTEAHREHVYQRAVIGGRSHAEVSGAVACANVLLIGIAALLAPAAPIASVVASLVLVVVLFVWLRPAPIPKAPDNRSSQTSGERAE
jgi:Fuc2NAc and GlcNAc transferase